MIPHSTTSGYKRGCRCEPCRAAMREYGRQYRQVHRAKVTAKDRDYYEANRERILVQKREYYERNRAKVLALTREHQKGFVEANPLFNTWKGMVRRCYDEPTRSFKNYGARGIRVYEEWRSSYAAFAQWVTEKLGPRPEGHTLDRIDNDGNYEPGNLRWATPVQQAANRRTAPSARPDDRPDE